MQSPADFRTRVRAVRLESKSFLQSVRAERLARLREALAPPSPAPTLTEVAPVEAPAVDVAPPSAPDDAPGMQDFPGLTVSANAARVSRLARGTAAPVAELAPPESVEAPRPAAAEPAEVVATETTADAMADVPLAEIEVEPALDVGATAEAAPEIEAPALDVVATAETAPELETLDVCASAEAAPEVEMTQEIDPALPDEPEVGPVPHADSPGPARTAVFRLLRPSVDEVGESDLKDLPGVGPGLIWMLAKLGVNSQADLARSDADDLSARLGIVGQLLDLNCWISRAQENVKEHTAA